MQQFLDIELMHVCKVSILKCLYFTISHPNTVFMTNLSHDNHFQLFTKSVTFPALNMASPLLLIVERLESVLTSAQASFLCTFGRGAPLPFGGNQGRLSIADLCADGHRMGVCIPGRKLDSRLKSTPFSENVIVCIYAPTHFAGRFLTFFHIFHPFR